MLRFEPLQTDRPPGQPTALVLSSANAVRALAAREDFALVSGLPAHCVGPTTADAARAAGLVPATVGAAGLEGLADKLKAQPTPQTFLAPGVADPAADLEVLLAGTIHRALLWPIYRMAAATTLPAPVGLAVSEGVADAVFFHSLSAARAFTAAIGKAGVSATGLTALCLSPRIADAVDNMGFLTTHAATSPREDALFALADAFALNQIGS